MTDLSEAEVCDNNANSDPLIHDSDKRTVNGEHDSSDVRLVNNNVEVESRKLRSKLSSISFGSTGGSKSQLSFVGRQYVPQKHGLCFISSLRSIPAFGFSTAPRFDNEKGKAGIFNIDMS
jgi:hypothetical protein